MRKLKYFKLYFLLYFLFFKISLGLAYQDRIEKRINIWPFFVYSKNKLTNSERLEIGGPIFYQYSFPYENGTSFRPFFSCVKTPQEKKIYFLSPLGIYKTNKNLTTFKFIPLINETKIKTDKEKYKTHFEFFPIFWGKTSQNETYGGLFPIYGKFKNKFGKKEIVFILWPLYSKIISQKNYIAINYIWPFIRILKNETSPSNNGFKFWPFYGHFKEEKKERKFVLWPFYIKEKIREENDYFEKLVIFPFYINENTKDYTRKILFWPFFQEVNAKNYFYNQIDAPWPFYKKIKGENVQGFRIWPIYGFVKKKNRYDSFLLWPFYFYKENDIQRNNSFLKEKEHKFLLFSKYSHTFQFKEPLKKEFRIWPLAYEYNEISSNNTKSLYYFPAILPFYDEGVERNYSAFLKLIEYYQNKDYKFFKLLWGLYRYEKLNRRSVQELAFLLRFVNSPDTTYIEFLEGLLGFGKIDKKLIIKIFFIPLTLENGKQKNRYLSGNF